MGLYYTPREIYDFYKPSVLPIKEELDAIQSVPEKSTTLKVSYDYPDWGWLPATFEDEKRKLKIEFSDAFSSLEELSRWLKDIATGSYSTQGVEVICDDEDIFHLFSFRPLESQPNGRGLFYLMEY
ncbi:MAG: hypothetical protein LIO91_09125 [Bacteroidales bacterium]|nr:hypothetical protein [Bacteroidales bacterium]